MKGIPKREGQKHALQGVIPIGIPALYPKVQVYLAGSFNTQDILHNSKNNYTEKKIFVKIANG
jgi:hypothetical protein